MILEREQLFEYVGVTPALVFVNNPLTLTEAFKRQARGWDIPLTLYHVENEGWRTGIDAIKLSQLRLSLNPHFDHPENFIAPRFSPWRMR